MMSQISTIVIYSYEFYIITGRNRCNGVVVTHLDHGRNFGCESRHIPRMKWSASGLFICDSFVFVGQQFDIHTTNCYCCCCCCCLQSKSDSTRLYTISTTETQTLAIQLKETCRHGDYQDFCDVVYVSRPREMTKRRKRRRRKQKTTTKRSMMRMRRMN